MPTRVVPEWLQQLQREIPPGPCTLLYPPTQFTDEDRERAREG